MREVLLISHELRTPLTVIRGYLDMLDQDDFTEDERRRIHARMREATEELARTIEVLIDRERRVAIAYGLEVPELIEPALSRSRDDIVARRTAERPVERIAEGPASAADGGPPGNIAAKPA